MQSDDHLLALVGEGDERALGHLYARYASVVFAFVLARVSDRGVAEEVSADVWLGCWRSARAFRRDAKVQDRKSTRLNSSHVASSYAVFCLKKKKHKTT